MRTIAILTTKHAYATQITQALGEDSYTYNVRGIPVIEIKWNNTLYKITYFSGHLMDYSYVFPQKKDIKYTDFLSRPIKMQDKESEATYLLESVIPKSDLVIVATENTPEGDCIAVEVAKLVSKMKYSIPVKRMRCNTFSYRDIKRNLFNPESIEQSKADSYNVLMMLEHIYQNVLTYQLSNYLSKKTRDHIGYFVIDTCQIPLLNLILEHEEAIEKERINEKWSIFGKIDIGNKIGVVIEPIENVFSSKQEASGRMKKIKSINTVATVQHIENRIIRIAPPKPLNFASLMTECGKHLDISTNEIINVLQELYKLGYISYPFTNEQEYPIDFDFLSPLKEWTLFKKRFTTICEKILENGSTYRGTSSRKTTPIYPCRPLAMQHDKDKKMQGVFSIIFRHYAGLLSGPFEIEQQKISFSVGNENFYCINGTILNNGWTGTYIFDLIELRSPLNCVPGDQFPLKKIGMSKIKPQLQPFSYFDIYTHAHKESSGFNTTKIIENCIRRGFLSRSQKNLKTTSLGKEIVKLFQKNVPIITSFNIRNSFNLLSLDVLSSKKTFDDAINQGIHLIELVSKSIILNENKIQENLEKILISPEFQIVGQCPKCKKALTVKQYTDPDGELRRFVGCYGYPECKNILSIPKVGTLEIVGLCPESNLPMFIVHTEKRDYKWGLGKGPCFQCKNENCQEQKKETKSRIIYTPNIDKEIELVSSLVEENS
ncbi:topoisomerase IA (plasmid) [Methanomethylovorans hollandica DSM 15978]|uniref:Topoisomerase IA n=1 Tax=Methanomethylovorans hollandica (strain DSM 15978 / NBRC 107637 / DMS1) TaxID=867904 RepID=L0L2K0_METHD|nr:DNA topoisomerase [Methanomethylovorans hollandica]AGB50648.1 topoisomerase IA [Methanomethylovorans hollandica DSM 15978]